MQKEAETLSEAIRKLEDASYEKLDEFKKVIDDLKPHLEEMKAKVETQVKKTKSEVETVVKENPWATFAIVGILAFIFGCIVGHRRKDENQ